MILQIQLVLYGQFETSQLNTMIQYPHSYVIYEIIKTQIKIEESLGLIIITQVQKSMRRHSWTSFLSMKWLNNFYTRPCTRCSVLHASLVLSASARWKADNLFPSQKFSSENTVTIPILSDRGAPQSMMPFSHWRRTAWYTSAMLGK